MEDKNGETAGKCIDVRGCVNGGLDRHPIGLTAEFLLLLMFIIAEEDCFLRNVVA